MPEKMPVSESLSEIQAKIKDYLSKYDKLRGFL